MSKFSRFMKQNKIRKENEKYAPTASLTHEDGKPLEFEFKHITSKENENLRDRCMYDVQIKGKPNQFRSKFNSSKYLVGLVVESTVYPDLYNQELQDSYGVKTPEELVYAMIDDPGEYQTLCEWIQKFQGFTENINDKVEEAKNS